MLDHFMAIFEAVQEGDQDKLTNLIETVLAEGISAIEVLEKGMVPGIEALGKKFTSGEFFLPEILLSARAMKRGIEVLGPHLPMEGVRKWGTVVIGTVEGDLHDLGKNLVKTMLECDGFNVVDLGIDVPASTFMEAVRQHKADIVAISALLTTTMVNIPKVIKALDQAGIRQRVKVMIGGAPVSRAYANEVGAEGFAEDCTAAIDEAKRLLAK